MCSRGGEGQTEVRRPISSVAQQPVGGAWQAEQAGERRTRQPNEDEAGQPDRELEGYLRGIYPPTVTESYTKPTWGTWPPLRR